MNVGEPEVARVTWSIADAVWGGLLALALLAGAVGGLALAFRALPALGGSLLALAVSLGELLLVVPVWWLAMHRRGATWRDLGLRRFRPLLGCGGAALLFSAILGIEVLWGLVLRRLGWAGQASPVPLFGRDPLGITLAVLGMGVIAPFSEELFFRGFLLPPLFRRLGTWPSFGIAAGLFAVLHFAPTVLPPILIMGLLFCVLYRYTGSIWPGILLHAAINLSAVAAAYLSS